CGTLLKSRYSFSSTIMLLCRLREVAKDMRAGEHRNDCTEREKSEHQLEDLVVETGCLPVVLQRDDRGDADDDAADDRDETFDYFDVHVLSLDEVENREQHNPDDVDEVPVQRACGQAEVFIFRVDARERLKQQHRQITHADEDVESVHAGERE